MRVLEMKKMCVTLLLAVNPAETDVPGANKGTRTSSSHGGKSKCEKQQ
jgi:hypothetical protein